MSTNDPHDPREAQESVPGSLDRRDLLRGAVAGGVGAALTPLVGTLAGLLTGEGGAAAQALRAGGTTDAGQSGGAGQPGRPGRLGPAGRPGRPWRSVPRNGDLIPRENAKAGTTDWLLANTRVAPGTRFRCPWIEGYCSRTSVRGGERLAFMVSTNPPSPFVIDIYRLGYYGGKGGRHVERLGPFPGRVQADPEIGAERLRDCRWEPAVEITIPDDPGAWPSGVYLGKLTAERGGLQSYVVFVVRDDRPCDVLFQCSDNTWAAYNRWPKQFSLYDNGSKVWYWGPGVRVSWNRPYGKYCQIVDAPLSQGSGEFLLWEMPAAFWLEQHGFDVSYTGNADTHADADGLLRGKLWLSVGHDEYWSLDMHRNVAAARDAGVNLAFLSANACYGVIDYHPDAAGGELRAIRRIGQYGPIDPRNVADGFTELLQLPHNGPDESLLVGARTGYPLTGAADWICTRPQHWVFEHTHMRQGDSIPGLVGWEFHGNAAPIPGLEVIAEGAVRPAASAASAGNGATYTATVYPGPKGNFVFNAATCWWADGLSAPPGYQHPAFKGSRPRGPDPRVQRITANLIRRAAGA